MVFAVTPWSAGLEAPAGAGLVTNIVPSAVTKAANAESVVRAPMIPLPGAWRPDWCSPPLRPTGQSPLYFMTSSQLHRFVLQGCMRRKGFQKIAPEGRRTAPHRCAILGPGVQRPAQAS